ncbi:TIF35 [Sanghuangporus weigelae]
MALKTEEKIKWGDEFDEPEEPRLPKPEETVDENGVITVVEYSVNDDGKKIKITKRIRRTVQKAVVQHAVAERKNWAKFGQEKGKKAGPDRATTTVGENVVLKLSPGNKSSEPEPAQEDSVRAALQKAGVSGVRCRICKRDHFTARCPFKDTLSGLEALSPAGVETPPVDEEAAPAATPPTAPTSGKYVPPSMRAGASRGAGETMGRPGANRDELPTLRVTNVSEDTTDQDLRDLFSTFGRVIRVYIGRDRETGQGKGFAFVSFEDRACAEVAIQRVNGRGYDNLILSVGWSQPREARP